MAEVGTVMEVKDSRVIVKLERKEACAKCKACMAGLKSEDMFLEAENLCEAKVGDHVNVSLEKSNFLKAVLIMYVIPLITFVIGIVGGWYVLHHELIALLIGLVFLVITYLMIKRNEEHFSSGQYRPIADKIIRQ